MFATPFTVVSCVERPKHDGSDSEHPQKRDSNEQARQEITAE